MPTLVVTKNYEDGTILLESDLDDIVDSITTWANVTKLDADNIQVNSIGEDQIQDLSVSEDKIIDSSVTKDKIEESQQLPPGVIMPYVSSTAPTGWLYCDGSEVSRTTYADLYAIIGDSHGEGDGSTTFHIPDYRGRFLRGFDDSTGRDPRAIFDRTAMNTGGNTGDAIGSVQDEDTAVNGLLVSDPNHSHTVPASTDTIAGGGTGSEIGAISGVTVDTTTNTSSESAGITLTHTGGHDGETRPINASIAFIIKT